MELSIIIVILLSAFSFILIILSFLVTLLLIRAKFKISQYEIWLDSILAGLSKSESDEVKMHYLKLPAIYFYFQYRRPKNIDENVSIEDLAVVLKQNAN